MTTKHHLDYIDLAKGFGIILVILGHGMFPNHFLIDSFHMPLFFILSGITFSKPLVVNAEDTKTWILKKIDRIFLPYVFFMVLSGLIELIVGKVNPDSAFNSPLWFLQTLFCASIIYYAISVKTSTMWTTVICAIIAISTFFVYNYTNIPSVLPFSLYRSLVSVVFIHIGALTSHLYKKDLSKLFSSLIATCAVTIFALSFYFCSKNISMGGAEAI